MRDIEADPAYPGHERRRKTIPHKNNEICCETYSTSFIIQHLCIVCFDRFGLLINLPFVCWNSLRRDDAFFAILLSHQIIHTIRYSEIITSLLFWLKITLQGG